jgi:hypothetical protein
LKIDEILAARHHTHGSFQDVAETAQALKAIIHHSRSEPYLNGLGGSAMSPRHLEALDLIATKLARICHGDPYQSDHWFDIEGYARLARERIDG